VREWTLGAVPERSYREALVIMRARREAAMHSSKKAGVFIHPDVFVGV
jgi:hypothetical protein